MKSRRIVFSLFTAATAAFADDRSTPTTNEHAKSLLERDALLGDFGGARTAAEARGMTFSLSYTQEYLGVVNGGLRRRGEYNGLVQLNIDLDLEKLVGWEGGLFHATGFAGWGESLSGRWIGDDSNVSNLNLRNGTRLFEAYLQQSFGDAFSIRAGLLATDSEFYASCHDSIHSRGGALFMNSDFGAIPILSFNVPEPIFPTAAPGVSVTLALNDAWTLRAAIYDGLPTPSDEFDDRNPHGLGPRVAAGNGALILAEAEYCVNKPAEEKAGDGKTVKSVATPGSGLGGCYRIGAFYHTGSFVDWDSGRSEHGLAGGWINGTQMVWRENATDDQGLSIFARVSAAPRDRSVLELGCDGGLHYHGLIPGREDDDLGLGVSVKRYSRDFDRAERLAGKAGRDHETIFEVSYSAQITPWLTVQPDVQYVLHPAGDPAAEDALVVGVRIGTAF